MTLLRAYCSNVDFPEPAFPVIQSKPRLLLDQLKYFSCCSSHAHVPVVAVPVLLGRSYMFGKANDCKQSRANSEGWGLLGSYKAIVSCESCLLSLILTRLTKVNRCAEISLRERDAYASMLPPGISGFVELSLDAVPLDR